MEKCRMPGPVVVIDDDDGLRDLVSSALTRFGYAVTAFARGADALQHIVDATPAAILIDQQLPDMTGRELIMRLSDRNLNIPFVVMTGQGNERLAVEMMKLGAFDYLVKDTEFMDLLPVTLERLFTVIMTRQSLSDSEERFKGLVDNAPFGLSLMDADQRFTFFNPQFVQMFGYTLEDVPDKNTWFNCAYPDPDYRQQVMTAWRDDRQRHGQVSEIQPREFKVRCKSGSDKIIHFRAANLSDGGQIVSYEDVTEHRLAEDDRERLRNQLVQARKLESIGRLAGGVAHDFNNMLQSILSHAELAMEAMSPKDVPYADLLEIQNAARHSAELTRQLLAFARKQIITPVVLDLNDTVAGVLKMLRRLIGENIELAWKSGHGVWPVKMDTSQVNQILANLIVNARDAIAGNGAITLWTGNVTIDATYCRHCVDAEPGDYVLLAVNDDGCGMDAETQANLFEPFFTTKTDGQGAGLGLPTVYGIIKQNRGFINVYSELGRGTTVKIYIPRHIGRPDNGTVGVARATPRGHGTILIAEDETTILAITKRMLQRVGYTVLAANTPNDAIRLAREYPEAIDALLTDVVMPVMNGCELAERVMRIRPGIKCLYMSGYTAEVIARHGILDDTLHFIEKPFSKKELAVKLQALLNA